MSDTVIATDCKIDVVGTEPRALSPLGEMIRLVELRRTGRLTSAEFARAREELGLD